MKCLITGAAGFIGSHLCEHLLRAGHEVTGLDAFIPYYSPAVKEQNTALAAKSTRFRLLKADLRTDALDAAVSNADVVFHLAAMPGLPLSWTDFDGYQSCNVTATQRLLEAVRHAGMQLKKFVYASTSSVYGRYALGDESLPTKPISPYGVTKLAAEHLCRAYLDAFRLPLVVLRFFSVYGPRQRPDMGYHKFIQALLRDQPLTIFGDGQHVRGNTYVDDCVAAVLAAIEAKPGETYNLGGGETATVLGIIQKLEAICGAKAKLKWEPPRPGDQRHTFADTTKLRTHFGWEPKIGLEEGLRRQCEWQRNQA